MTGPLWALALAFAAFAGANAEGLAVIGHQLSSAERRRHRRIAEGQLLATILLLAVAAVAGVAFATIPRPWVGLLGLVPVATGARAGLLLLRRRSDDRSVPLAGGLTTSLLVALAIGAGDMALYVPVLATGTKLDGILSVITWLAMDIAMLALARQLSARPSALARIGRVAPRLHPPLAMAVGLAVLLRSLA